MPRIVEVQNPESGAALAVAVGDVISFIAHGARVCEDKNTTAPPAVELHGPFVQSVVGPAGEVLTPAGPPNVVLCYAKRPGIAQIEVMTGDPWRESQVARWNITVAP